MPPQTILVVDDEEDILELVGYHITRKGHEVLYAATGQEALALAAAKSPDLIILDLLLPELNGLEVCKRLKQDPSTKLIPILMLTAKSEEADIVTGLELGAEDYVTKPFSPKVLMARVELILRRKTALLSDSSVLKIHDLVIDPTRHEVRAAGKLVELTFTEFRTLHALAKRPGQVFTRYQIVDAIRGGDYAVTDRSVDVQIVSLRKKLGKCGKYIETVRGVGYRFRD